MHHRHHHAASDGSTLALATGLGWFSLGLGAVELLAAPALARALGMEGRENLLRAYGLREAATGIGILTQEDPTPWMWGRVAGDALDLATLGAELKGNPRAGNVGLAIAAVAGAMALDVICARALTAEREEAAARPVRDYSDRVGLPRPPEAMRGAARDFEVPHDFRIPEPLRPYGNGSATGLATLP